jgi:hypothetical protein
MDIGLYANRVRGLGTCACVRVHVLGGRTGRTSLAGNGRHDHGGDT